MPELIANNLMRRIGRTLLTALGVGLGVATIVALLSVSDGLTQTAAGFAHLGGSDLGVFQAGVSDPTVSVLQTSQVARLERNPDVASATPLLLIVSKVRSDPSAFVFGADPNGFFARRLVFASGGPPSRGTIAIGSGLAATLHQPVGGTLVVAGHRFTVSGIYHSGHPLRGPGRGAAAARGAGAHRPAGRDDVDRRRARTRRERGRRDALDPAPDSRTPP